MKKCRIIQLGAGIFLLAGTISASLSLAWFHPSTNIGNKGETNAMPIDGSSSSSYFAYGDGSAEKPFGIKNPRHLYNLAWLQYINHFQNQQKYFELADNIDMSGWTLPPIGTEDYPFISYFDGQGYAVSNLTVSNNFSDYNVHPSVVNGFDTTNKQPHILGVFGVVGNYNNLPATSYSSATNQLIDTGIYNATIKTSVRDSLMGVAAGYVDADLKNVVVDNSTLNIDSSITNSTYYNSSFTTNISDYTILGYTTKKNLIKKGSQKTYGINLDTNITFNATEDGSANGWGGSIDMKSVLLRLQTIRKNYTTGSRFEYKKTYEVHDGVRDNNYTATRSTNNRTYAYANDTAHKEWGHFHIMADGSGDLDNYSLLGGGHLEIDNHFVSTEHNGYKITDGTNYLNLNMRNESVENGTADATATVWTFSLGNSSIYYRYINADGLTNDTTTYYLYNNNGTLEISTYNQTNWNITSVDENNITIKSGNYYLIYFGGAWTLYDPSQSASDYYLIHDGNGHYISEGSSYNVSETDRERATHWLYGTSRDGDPLYYCNSDKYLGYYGDSFEVQAYNDSRAFYTLVSGATSGTGLMSATYYGTTYYICYDDGWTAYDNQNDATTMTVELVHAEPPSSYNLLKTSYLETKGPDERFDRTESFMNYTENDVTYFPLTTVNNTNNFDPADNNTAYITAGSSIKTSDDTYTASMSNVRFASYYSISGNISNDYSTRTGKFTHIYTINDNMQREEITNKMSDYERLKDSSTALASILSQGTQTYGLHFMESTISKDAITTAKYVKVNNVVHTDYELPVNSIDFNLKEFGYVNFIAGSYFNRTAAPAARNDSFFALYQIERLPSDPNKINRILEVKGVYQHTSKAKNVSYVYELSDGTNTFYTKPYKVTNSEGGREWLYDTETEYSANQYESSLPSNYVKAFDTKRIKKNNLNSNTFDKHVYYFEIPMNDGEFCLGSVSGGVGSYLMYLDIGANAAKTQRTVIYEKFSISEKTFEYPNGVSLGSLPSTYSSSVAVVDTSSTIDSSDTVCMMIKVGANGAFKMDRNENDVALTRTQAPNAPPTFSGDNITKIHETGSDTNIEPVPLSETSREIKRMQYYDYMINTDTLVVTTFTDTSTDGGSTYTRQVTQSKYSGHLVDSTKLVVSYSSDSGQIGDMKIYRSDTGVKYTSTEITSQTSIPIAANKLSSTVILEIKLTLDNVDSHEDTITFVAAVDPSSSTDMYYVFDGYEVVITPSSGTITVKVITYPSTFSVKVLDVKNNSTSTVSATNSQKVNGTTVTGSGQTIVVEYQAPTPEP